MLGDKSNSVMFDNSKIKSVVGDFSCETALDAMLANAIDTSRAAADAAPTGELNQLFDRIAADQKTVGTNGADRKP